MALKGIKVVEMIGLAPGPLCGTILADFGATVTVVQKLHPSPADFMTNGKRSISIDLKSKDGIDVFKKLCTSSDVLIDAHRPGILEKLGLGPEVLLKDNSRLIYAKLTGYGQSGYYKAKAGHEINYFAMSGVLSLPTTRQPPQPTANLITDFVGVSVTCALGILLALFERVKTGKGQLVDASTTEVAAYLATWLFKAQNSSFYSNILKGGTAFYGTYKTKDNKFMALAAMEPQFYSNLLKGMGLSEDIYSQFNVDLCKQKFEEIFLTKTQKEWCEVFEKLDACVSPVLNIEEVDKHECNVSRRSFYRDHENHVQPEPAPKLSASPGVASGKQSPPKLGEHTIMILKELGYTQSKIQELIKNNCIYAHSNSHL